MKKIYGEMLLGVLASIGGLVGAGVFGILMGSAIMPKGNMIIVILFPFGMLCSLIGGGCCWLVIGLRRTFHRSEFQEVLREATLCSWGEISLSSMLACGMLLVLPYFLAFAQYGFGVVNGLVTPMIIAGSLGICGWGLFVILNCFPRFDLFTKGRNIGIGTGCGLGGGMVIGWMLMEYGILHL